MPHLTTCTTCGKLYEESSEEHANAPAWYAPRLCPTCHKAARERQAQSARRHSKVPRIF